MDLIFGALIFFYKFANNTLPKYFHSLFRYNHGIYKMETRTSFFRPERTVLKIFWDTIFRKHYNDVIMGTTASQITSLTVVYSTVYSGADQRKHQSSASLAFVRGIHRWPMNSLHKWPVTRKMFPFDDVLMIIDEFPRYINNRNCCFHSIYSIHSIHLLSTWNNALLILIAPFALITRAKFVTLNNM